MKILESLPKSVRDVSIYGSYSLGLPQKSLYPWGEWFDGQPREATKDVDFKVKSETFRVAVIKAAKELGVKVHTRKTPDGIAFQSEVAELAGLEPALQ